MFTFFTLTYISTKHVVRVAHKDSIEPNSCNGVHAVKDKKHLLFGPVDAESAWVSQDQDTESASKMI